MKRLFNENGQFNISEPHADHISKTIREALKTVSHYVMEHDLDTRDTENICFTEIGLNFAGLRLSAAISRQKAKREALKNETGSL